jgi:hypothetical protein
LRAFVRLRDPEDRVWITVFENEFQDFDIAHTPAHDVLANEGFQQMQALGTGSEGEKPLWARERIAVLVAAKRSHEAVALAKTHNILCEPIASGDLKKRSTRSSATGGSSAACSMQTAASAKPSPAPWKRWIDGSATSRKSEPGSRNSWNGSQRPAET